MATNKPELDSARLIARTRTPLRASVVRFKQLQERATITQPEAYLGVDVNGRENSYFEWLGAGIHCPDRRAPAQTQNACPQILRELRYGFDERFFYLRVDPFPDSFFLLRDVEFRIALRGNKELRLLVGIEAGRFAGSLLDTEDVCILGPHELAGAAFDKILEVSIGRKLLRLEGCSSIELEVGLWREGIPLDRLPLEGSIEVKLGADAFAWPVR
jgi:hypothetical protein